MHKQILSCPIEIKALGEREFEGHGSIFKNVDLGGDVVMPGAFKRTLAKWKELGQLPAMLWSHDQREPAIGKWMTMREDDRGLFVRGKLADTDRGNEVLTLMKMEAIGGLSIGYLTNDYDYDKDGNRLLKEIELFEVSPVNIPMNPLAKVTDVKSLLADREQLRGLEAILRDVGLSQSDAVTAISGFKAWVQRDVGSPSIAPRDEVTTEEAEARAAAEQLMAKFATGCLKF
jgi:HK97 family phage prohead protease